MKRMISIIIFILAGIFIVLLAKKNNYESKDSTKSAQYFMQEGINYSKQKKYNEALTIFNEAFRSTEINQFKLFSDEVKNFSTIINNMKKNSSSKYFELYSKLSDPLKDKIDKLQKSSEIDESLKVEFTKEVDKLLLNDDFINKLKNDYCKDFIDEIAEKIKLIKSGKNTYEINEESLKRFCNRVILSTVFHDFFKLPITLHEIKFNIALMNHSKQEYKKSSEILDEIIKNVPLYGKAYILKARNYEKIGDLKSAISSLSLCLEEKDIKSEEIYTELAALYHKMNDNENAKKMLNAALSINPNYSYALESIDVLDRKTKGKLKPISYYIEKIKKDGENLNNLSNLSLAYLKTKEFAKSEETVMKALTKYPDDVFLLKLKARILGNQRKYMEVLNLLNKLKKVTNNKDPEIYLLIGVTYFNQQLNSEAYEILKEGVTNFPNDAYLNLNMGMICEVMPEHDSEAIVYYEKYLNLKPSAKNNNKITTKIEGLKLKRVK